MMASVRREPVDEARLLERFRQACAARIQIVKIQQAVTESREDDEQKPRHELTKPGDPEKLRGIPVIGRGVGGAIKGSSPHQIRDE